MSRTNLTILTQAHKAIAAKKRAKREQIKEVVFDDQARREFLTGFHKRKLAKAEAARNKAIEREKQQRLEARREQRCILRERASENAAEVERAYGGVLATNDDEDEWTGISLSTGKDKGKQKEEEYEDAEILATVTVVEDFDPDSFIHGTPPKMSPPAPQPAVAEAKPKHTRDAQHSKKKVNVKIKYETKTARKIARTKQRSRRTEKAELAGGKASRRKESGSSKRKGRSK